MARPHVRTGRLTRRGVGLLAFAAIAALAGWSLGIVELAVLSVAAVVAVGASLAWLAARPKVEVFREIHPDRVTAGDLSIGRVRVRNTSTRRAGAFVAVERFGDRFIPVELPALPPGERKSTTYRLPTERRGVVAVGPMAIGRSDPLGLVQAEQAHGEVITLWVHPRHFPLDALPASLTRSLEGPTSDTAPSGTVTFHAIREYELGDDLRHVHWRSTAHTGDLMVKHYVDTSLPDATVVLDLDGSRHDDASFEVAMEAAASVVLASTSRRYPLRMLTTEGLRTDTKGGGNASQEILDTLALQEPGTAGLGTTLDELTQARGATALVIITARPDPAVLARAAVLPRRYGVVVLVDTAPGDVPVAAPSGVRVISARTGEEFAAAWNRAVRR